MRRAPIYCHLVSTQVFTGEVPFDTSQPPAAAIAILKGDCPPRPIHSDCSDELWVLMQRCWSREPRSRPKVSEVFQILPSSDFDRLQRLYMPGMASQEFQLALNRSYGSTDYQNRIHDLRGANLRKYVNFLDTVQQPSNLFHPIHVLTLCLGTTDEGIKSKPPSTNIAQPTESLQPSGHDSELPRNLR